MDLPSPGIVVTGANGQLGRALLAELADQGRSDVRALVRSQRARATIDALGLDPAPEVRIVDYASPKGMEEAIRGANAVVHLVGIIKEMPGTRYVEAHERTCHALALAASRAEVRRIVYLSILGASPDSENVCLASKGRAESLLLDDRVATAVLRVPMVLGGDDPASGSLRRQARSDTVWLPGGGRTLQQPIDARGDGRGDDILPHVKVIEQEPDRLPDVGLDSADTSGGVDHEVRGKIGQVVMGPDRVQQVQLPAGWREQLVPRQSRVLEEVPPDHPGATRDQDSQGQSWPSCGVGT